MIKEKDVAQNGQEGLRKSRGENGDNWSALDATPPVLEGTEIASVD